MNIDSFDNTLVCKNDDFQTVLSFFKDTREVPNYIEKSILEIILYKLYSKDYCFETIEEYLECLPDRFVQDIIQNINSMYFNQSKVSYVQNHLSYLVYYLSANIFKVWKPLLDLLIKNTLKPNIRILDIGTGPGSIPIGIFEFYKALAGKFPEIYFKLSFSLVDAEEEFLDIATKIINKIGECSPPNIEVSIERIFCRQITNESVFDDFKGFDIISMSNFITSTEGININDAVSIINNLRNSLDDYGSFIIIEPGDKGSCKGLKEVRNAIVNRKIFNIFSPCVGVWEEKSNYNCKCFNMVRCYWKIPCIYEYLVAKGLNKAKRVDVPFNYVVLRKDKIKKYDPIRNQQHYVKLADLNKYINMEVNVKSLIRTVIYKDDLINISLCDGSCSFEEDNKAVWIYLSYDYLKQIGIYGPLIAAERITLKKVSVILKNKKLILEANKDSHILIDY